MAAAGRGDARSGHGSGLPCAGSCLGPRSTVGAGRPRARPQRQRPTPARALAPSERQAVLDVLHAERFCDRSPPRSTPRCSTRAATCARRARCTASWPATTRSASGATSCATRTTPSPSCWPRGPNQVWSWDITKLKGPAKWAYFYLYVILDIFSRYVVGWLLAQHENAGLAQRLIRETCTKQGIEPGQLTLHADRGAPMTSKTLASCSPTSGSRRPTRGPTCPTTIPFSESQFKTLKYSPGFPDRFGSPEHAREMSRVLLNWYNHEHHHSALCYLTPAVVHYGRAEVVLAERHRVQLAAYREHPERFVNGPPRPQTLPEAVWINPPEKPTHQDALGTTQTDPDDLRVVPIVTTYVPLVRPGALSSARRERAGRSLNAAGTCLKIVDTFREAIRSRQCGANKARKLLFSVV